MMIDAPLSTRQVQIEFAALRAQGWRINDNHSAISKRFTFGDFTAAMAWMSQLAKAAEQMNHHPDWRNSYHRVDVTLTTHSAQGLTVLDRDLAQVMEDHYAIKF